MAPFTAPQFPIGDDGSEAPVDLSNCENEPIHIPSAVQPHGLMICVNSSFDITQVSENIVQWLGCEPFDLFNTSLANLIEEADFEVLKTYLRSRNLKTLVPLSFDLKTKTGESLAVSCFAHVYENFNILEFEPSQLANFDSQFSLPAKLTKSIDSLQRAETLGEALHSVAVSIKKLTGYDRVMVYKFDKDWHGEVVAEAKELSLDPLLGMRYPSSDIPIQARNLYKRNLLRMIVDVNYNAVNVVPRRNPSTGMALDMSDCILRSVSPIHVEYLLNMGVKGTLTISLMVHGELWGLVACHHYSPKHIPLWMRSACELFGQLVGLRILGFSDAERYRMEAQTANTFDEIAGICVLAKGNISKGFELFADKLCAIFHSPGAAFITEDNMLSFGKVPGDFDMRKISVFLAHHSSAIVATDYLRQLVPEISTSQLAGMLAVRTSTLRSEWIVCFREEQTRLVNWAGDPRKSVTVGPDGVRLHPRGSFALWSEEVKDRAVDWADQEVVAVTVLRQRLLELQQESLDRERQHRESLRQQREDTVSAIVHDLKNPILGSIKILELVKSGKLGKSWPELESVLDQLLVAQKQLYERVQSFLVLQKYDAEGTTYSFVPVDLKSTMELAVDMCVNYAKAESISLDVSLQPGLSVRGERDALARVIENLINNAIKYTPASGQVFVNLTGQGSSAIIRVVDNGPGISEAELPFVFKRFWQGDSGQENQSGSGLGLYSCRQIVGAHQGSIRCESNETGSTFIIVLPLIEKK